MQPPSGDDESDGSAPEKPRRGLDADAPNS
jgi:hypothetical protein